MNTFLRVGSGFVLLEAILVVVFGWVHLIPKAAMCV